MEGTVSDAKDILEGMRIAERVYDAQVKDVVGAPRLDSITGRARRHRAGELDKEGRPRFSDEEEKLPLSDTQQESVRLYKSERRVSTRARRIDRKTFQATGKRRQCPRCMKVKADPGRSWIVEGGYGFSILCRSCWALLKSREQFFMAAKDIENKDITEIINDSEGDGVESLIENLANYVFDPFERRYPIHGERLKEARKKAGLSQADVSRLCSWTRVWQSKLENGEVRTVDEQTRDALVEVLSSYIRSQFMDESDSES